MGNKQRRKAKKVTACLLALALCLPSVITGDSVRAAEAETVSPAPETTLQNPRIVQDDTMRAGQKVTWDCVWFGSYPQAEVVTSAMAENYTPVGEEYLQDGDLVVDDAAYAALQNTDDDSWDANGDTTYNGNKYRRMKKGDATQGTSGSPTCYNWPDTDTYHYFLYQPIKWRVLSTDGSKALLLSDVALDGKRYHEQQISIKWENSTIRSWLNGYGTDANGKHIDYSGKSFLEAAFTAASSAIEDTFLPYAPNLHYGYSVKPGNDTTDKVFFLADSDVYTNGFALQDETETAKAHGFISDKLQIDEARMAKSSTYAKAMGGSFGKDYAGKGNCRWWLRSPGGAPTSATAVYDDGMVGYTGNSVCDDCYCSVRPALYLNLSYSKYYSYAGTVCSDEIYKKTGDDDTPTGDGTGEESTEGGNGSAGGNTTGGGDSQTGGSGNSGSDTGTGEGNGTASSIPTPTPNPPAPTQTGDGGGAAAVQEGASYSAGKAEYDILSVTDKTVSYKGSTRASAKSLTIPDSVVIEGETYQVTKVAKAALANHKKLKNVTVGSSVTVIEERAFADCKNLKKITIQAENLQKVGKNAIKGIDKKAKICVPKGKKKAYKELFTNKTGYKKNMKFKEN